MAKQKIKKGIGKPEDKQKTLESLRGDLEKEFGKGIVVTGNQDEYFKIERIPSGSIGLDIALNGGYGKGRIIEVLGSESSAKTSICLHAVAECQKLGGSCLYIDAESSIDVSYAKNIGVDIDELLISQPTTAEQGLNLIEKFVRSGAVDLIVIDSVAALSPQNELEGEIGQSNMCLQARLMSQAMRMLVGPVAQTNTTIIFVNQYRSSMAMYGPSQVASSGNSLKYYASQRIDLKRIEILEEGEDKTGIRVRAKIIKNKIGPPFRETEFNVIFGKGIDYYTDLLEIATKMNIINKGGAWYSYNGTQIGQGTIKATNYLKEHLDIAEEIKNKLFNNNKTIQQNFENMMEISEDGEV